MALNFLLKVDDRQNNSKLTVDNKKNTSKVSVESKPIPKQKLRIIDNDMGEKVLTVDRSNSRGQLMRSLAIAGRATNTGADSIKLTGLSEPERKKRESIIAQQKFEKAMAESKAEMEDDSLLGNLLRTFPKAVVDTGLKTRDFGVSVARDTARSVAAINQEGAGLLAEATGTGEKEDYDNLPVSNSIAKFIFGKEPIRNISGVGATITGNEDSGFNAPLGIVVVGLDALPGGGKAGKFVAREGAEQFIKKGGKKFVEKGARELVPLADDIMGSADDIDNLIKSMNEVAVAPKSVSKVADEFSETVEQAIAPRKVNKVDDIKQTLQTSAKGDHKTERIVQTKLRGGEAPQVGKTVLPKTVNPQVPETAYQQTVKNGGVTINVEGAQPSQGFAYAPNKGTEVKVPSVEFTPQHTVDFINKNEKELLVPGNHIGIWEDEGNIYLDISRVGTPDAKTLAEAQGANQLAVFDLENFTEIPTGQIGSNGVYSPLDEATNIFDQYKGKVSSTGSQGDRVGLGEISGSQAKIKEPNKDYLKAQVQSDFETITGKGELGSGAITKSEFKLPQKRRTGAFISSTGKLSRMGESGSELATRINLRRDLTDSLAGDMLSKLQKTRKLKGKDHETFVQALDDLSRGVDPGKLDPKITEAIEEWTQFAPYARQTALNVGMDVGDRGKYYFPRSYDEIFSDTNKFEQAVRHLVDSKQVADETEALEVLRRAKKQMSRPNGNLEFSRKYDLPFYDKSPKAVADYLRGFADRVAGVQYLGPDDEVAIELITQAGKEGHDMEKMLQTYMTAIGITKDANSTAAKASTILRKFQGITKLSAAAIANAGQITNTATVTGIYNTLKGALKAFDPATRKQIEQMGAVSDQIISALQSGAGFEKGLGRKIGAPFFSNIEKFNRLSSAIAGKEWAEKLARKGDPKSIKILQEKLGVTGIIRDGKLTESQLGEAVRGVVNKTQFRVDPQDLPEWTASPYGKLVAQFRTFSYKQSGFMWNEVIKEAGRGNVAPLARFIAFGIPLGLATGAVRDVVKGRDIDTEGNPIVRGARNVGGLSVASDVGFLWETRTSPNFSQYAAGAIGGPSAGTLVELFNSIGAAARGNPKQAGRQALKTIPTVGPYLSNQIFPFEGSTTSTKSKSKSSRSTRSSTKKSGRLKSSK